MSEDVRLLMGDCLERMAELPAESVDAVVTDPPAGISFMGKTWDKPGVLGVSGGVAMPVTTASRNPSCKRCGGRQRAGESTKGCTCDAPQWNDLDYRIKDRTAFIDFLTPRLTAALRLAKPGARMLCWAIPRTSHWTGTAIEDAGWIIEDRVSHLFGQGFPKAKSKLKPALEDWWLARKASKGVPDLNIDACRINVGDEVCARPPLSTNRHEGYQRPCHVDLAARAATTAKQEKANEDRQTLGRWPANLVLSHHPDCNGSCVEGCPVAELDRQSGDSRSRVGQPRSSAKPGLGWGTTKTGAEYDDSGGASRFFYVAKASRTDRGDGNIHPTVKSTDLMRWLCRLITPEGGLILDPFAGSGSTGKAAVMEGFGFLGIESDPAYFAVAESRIAAARAASPLFDRPAPARA